MTEIEKFMENISKSIIQMQPVNIVTDNDLFIILQDPNNINSVTAEVLKQYMGGNYTPAAPTIGQAGQVLTSNGSGGVFWSSIDGGVVTTRYQDLTFKPTVNGVEFVGNMTSNDLHLADKEHTHTIGDITDFPALAEVAMSGSYEDLSDKPDIPKAVSYDATTQSGLEIGTLTIGEDSYVLYAPDQEQTLPQYRLIGSNVLGDGYRSVKLQKSLDDGSSWTDISSATIVPSIVSAFTNDAGYVKNTDLGSVAFSGSYTDLTDTPTIPDAVSFEPTILSGTKIGEITIGDTTTDIYSPIPEFDAPLFYGLAGDNQSGSGYKTFNFVKSYDGEIWDIQNSVSIPDASFSAIYDSGIEIGTFSWGEDSTTIYIPSGSGGGSVVSFVADYESGTKIGTITIDDTDTDIYIPSGSAVEFCDVSLQNSEYGTIVGPTKVVKGADAIYKAKCNAGYTFNRWINVSTTSVIPGGNPLVINITDDLVLGAEYDEVVTDEIYEYVLLTDKEQISEDMNRFIKPYTMFCDNEPIDEVILYELLQMEIFQHPENVDMLCNEGIDIDLGDGVKLYRCEFNNGDNNDCFGEIQDYLRYLQDITKIYVLFDKFIGGFTSMYYFNLYKYTDVDNSNSDSEIFGFVYPYPCWVKLGTLTVSKKGLGEFLVRCSNHQYFDQHKLQKLLTLIGPTEMAEDKVNEE